MKRYTDVLIIGSGVAGLSFAIKLAEKYPWLSISLVTKSTLAESNTFYAQGGIAAVMQKDQVEISKHINDTIRAGRAINDQKIVRMVVQRAAPRIQELLDWGTHFDATTPGKWDYAKEGGHSVARILHDKDHTGKTIALSLLKQAQKFPQIHWINHCFAVDLIVNNNICHGAKMLKIDSGISFSIIAKFTYLATGGSGQAFLQTTNPTIATGDGIALAKKAGAKLKHMRYYQFHPTAIQSADNPLQLATEALRGYGAFLLNAKQQRFLHRYTDQGELAPRDVVFRAMLREARALGNNDFYIDLRHKNALELKSKFPKFFAHCLSMGLDPVKDYIPIVPAAHYQCGGIEVDRFCRTSVQNLLANGECAYTGMHGANRLASNSLLEAIVFAHEAAVLIGKTYAKVEYFKDDLDDSTLFRFNNSTTDSVSLQSWKHMLSKAMQEFYYNYSLQLPLIDAKQEVFNIVQQIQKEYKSASHFSVQHLELFNLCTVVESILNDCCYD
ncbi:MAG: FAD-dependent oxidoreductase [Flavobacteriaceae bacterium]|nr:FAD-dependent oxidoreductase [Flavobacteriaceae bacterium]